MELDETNKKGYLGFSEIKAFLFDLGYSNPSIRDTNWTI